MSSELMGCYIVRTYRKGRVDGLEEIRYEVIPGLFKRELASPSKGVFFVTSKAFRNKWEKLEESKRKMVQNGYVTVSRDAKAKRLRMEYFFPLPIIDKDKSRKTFPIDGEVFRNLGFGTLIETQVERDLTKLFPKHVIYSSAEDLSGYRSKQLITRGRRLNELMPIERAHQLSVAQTVSHYRKNKPVKEIEAILRGKKIPITPEKVAEFRKPVIPKRKIVYLR